MSEPGSKPVKKTANKTDHAQLFPFNQSVSDSNHQYTS